MVNVALSTCAFCERQAQLRDSHIIPAFVFRWLRETGGTGHMRSAENPNRRVQDGLKLKFLCHECEARFNQWETAFATKLFHPFHADTGVTLVYSDWLAKFCASVSWRALAYFKHIGKTDDLSPLKQQAIEAALSTWKQFLLGTISNPGRFEQHLLPIPGIESTSVRDLPNNINRYLMRVVELDLPMSDHSELIMTMTKMGPFILFGYVIPPKTKWLGTKIAVAHGHFSPQKYALPMPMLDYLKDRAERSFAAVSNVSDAQHRKMNDTLMANLDRFRSSSQFEAIMRDHDMFGRDAVIRK